MMRRSLSLAITVSLAFGHPLSAWAQVRYQSGSQATAYRVVSPVFNFSYPRVWAAPSLSSSLSAAGLSAQLGPYASGLGGLALSPEVAAGTALSAAGVQAVAADPGLVAAAPPSAQDLVALPKSIVWGGARPALEARGAERPAPRQGEGVFGGLEKLAAQKEDAAQAGPAFFDLLTARSLSGAGLPVPVQAYGAGRTAALLHAEESLADKPFAIAPPALKQLAGDSSQARLRNALFFGITVSLFAPVLMHTTRGSIILYTTPTALILTVLLGAAVYGPYALALGVWNAAAGALTPRRSAARLAQAWADIPRATFLAAGVILGLAAAVTLPGLLSAVPSAGIIYTVMLASLGASASMVGYLVFRRQAFLVAGAGLAFAAAVTVSGLFSAVWGAVVLHTVMLAFLGASAALLGYRIFRLLQPLIRLSIGAAVWLLSKVRLKAHPPKQGLPSRLSKYAYFVLGLLPGVGLALVVPFLVFWISQDATELMGYAGTAFIVVSWILWTVTELVHLVSDAVRSLWRHRRDLFRLKQGAIQYSARLLLGLALGAMPMVLFYPIARIQARLLEAGAQQIAAHEDVMSRLPDQWQSLVRHMSEPLEFNGAGSEGVYFEGGQEYLRGPDGWLRGGPLNAKTIARAYLPSGVKGKRLTILISGSGKTVDELRHPSRQSLLAYLYYTLRDRGQPVIWFRSGDSMQQVRGQIGPGGRFMEESGMVEARTRAIASDVILALDPSEVDIVGHSWGGGRIVDLSHNPSWLHGVRVRWTIALDPIRTGVDAGGLAEDRRPNFGRNRHVHLFQRPPPVHWRNWVSWRVRDWLLDLGRSQLELRGAALAQPCQGDHCEQIHGVDHAGMLWDVSLRQRVLSYLDN